MAISKYIMGFFVLFTIVMATTMYFQSSPSHVEVGTVVHE
ncbi:hypothetical protein bcgnr5369_25660 [Bacillus cereus]